MLTAHPPTKHVDHTPAVYVLRCTTTGRIKIGSSYRPAARAAAHTSSSPTDLELLGFLEPDEPSSTWDRDYGRPARSLERHLHVTLRHERVKGEWFAPTVTLDRIIEAAHQWEADRA